MAKRFIASEIWDKDWFLGLPSKYKVLWVYMITKCDVAGVFDPNLKTVSKLLNEKYGETEVLAIFDGKIHKVQDKWLLVKFISFQYGHNLSSFMVKPINNSLRKIGLDLDTVSIQYQDSINTVKDKDKDKDKDKRGVIGEIINDSNVSSSGNNNSRHIVPKTDTNKVFDYFCLKYKEVLSQEYVANLGKDKKLIKDLLRVVKEDELTFLINRFFESEDEFIQKSGFTLGVFKSQINKLRGGKLNTQNELRKELGLIK